MNKLQHLFLGVAAVLCLASCSQEAFYYQVYDMQTDASLQKTAEGVTSEQGFVAQNTDCKISYDFWSKGGNLNFDVQNTSDRNIYFYLPECFTVINGRAQDYYVNMEYSSTVSRSVSNGVSVGVSKKYSTLGGAPSLVTLGKGASSLASSAQTVQEHAPVYVCIPAHSSKQISCPVSMCSSILLDCDYEMFPKKESSPITFTKESSPLVVENRIAYGYTPDGKNLVRLNHKFWLSKLVNYKDCDDIYNKVKLVDCFAKSTDWNVPSQVTKKYWKIGSSSSFYNTYSKSNIHLYRVGTKEEQENANKNKKNDELYNYNSDTDAQ